MYERLITINIYYEAPDDCCGNTHFWKHTKQYSSKELGPVLYELIDNCIDFTIEY